MQFTITIEHAGSIRVVLEPDPQMLAELTGLRSDVASLRAAILTNQGATMTAFERLTGEVAETRGAIASLRTLTAGLSAYIRANVTDQAALNALADSLDQGQGEIAQAITENPIPGEVVENPPPPPEGGSGEPEAPTT